MQIATDEIKQKKKTTKNFDAYLKAIQNQMD